MIPKNLFPMRINRYLALEGVAARRHADDLIKAGRVFINGKKAVLGDKINEKDQVTVEKSGEKFTYFLYNKPKGTTTEEATQKVDGARNLFPVGRLDKESEGLILLTDDGRVVTRLLEPEKHEEKEYLVTLREKPRPGLIAIFKKGMLVDKFQLLPAKAEFVDDYTVRVTLVEGKKHQLRRMFDALHYTTEKLIRVRIGTLKLGTLKSGASRRLQGTELDNFLSSISLSR